MRYVMRDTVQITSNDGMNDQKWLSLIDKMIVTRFEGRLSPFKVAGIECPVYAYKDIIIVILDVIASQRTQAIDRNVPTWTWTKSHSRCRMMHGGMSGYLRDAMMGVCCLLSAVCCLLSAVCVFPRLAGGSLSLLFFALMLSTESTYVRVRYEDCIRT